MDWQHAPGQAIAADGKASCSGRLHRFLAGTALAACLLPATAAAQDAAPAAAEEEEPVDLMPLVVEETAPGESPTGPVEGYVARQTTTGAKTDTPLLEVPQSISVITRDQMDDRAVQTLGEALEYSAGVVAQPFGADPRFDSPIIRGFSAANSQYLNGLKLERDQGATALDPYGMERIEVLRGPSSVLYGQGNPGGLINMVSKRPVWEQFGEVNFEAGSFDQFSGSFDFSGPVQLGSQLAYRMTGVVRSGGSEMDYVEDQRLYLAPAVTWAPSDDITLTVLTNVQYDEPGTPVGMPVEYTLDDDGARLARSTYLGDPDFDDSTRTLASVGYEFEYRFAEDWAFRQNGRYLWLDWDYQALYYSSLDASDPSIANRGASYQDEQLGTFTLDNQLQFDTVTGPLDHTLLVGVDYRHHSTDTLSQFGTAPSIDVFDPEYGQTITDSIWYSSQVDGTLSQTGLYAQDQVALDRWLLTFGIRHDWASTDSTTESNFGDSEQDQQDQATTYRAGLTYVFDFGLAPYFSYSTSFEPVIGNMPEVLGGGAFEPSRGKQYELGLKYQPPGWDGFFTATVYDLKQTNVESSELIDGVSYTVQTGEVKVQGLELSALASLAEGLNLIANYTYTDAEIAGGSYDGNRPANVPKNAANAWLDYKVPTGEFAGVGLGGGVRYIGSRYDLDQNTNKLDANTVFDAALSYQYGPIKASLNVNNIADKRYVASCGFFGCYYGEGRTVIGQLTYQW